jgi:hypothetical protein
LDGEKFSTVQMVKEIGMVGSRMPGAVAVLDCSGVFSGGRVATVVAGIAVGVSVSDAFVPQPPNIKRVARHNKIIRLDIVYSKRQRIMNVPDW